MEIIFKNITLENFKNQSNLSTGFGDITNIYGRNGAGKSTIADAVAWVLFGVDQLGTKLDPNPIENPELESKVTLIILADGQELILTRAQKKTAKYYIDEIPKKATEFNQLVKDLFDENLFLSMFSPTYFFTQNWKDQRAQVLQYVDEPLNSEVFAVLPDIQSNLLQEHLKKHSLDELESKHKERFKDRDTQYTRVAERLLTLQEQLERDSDSEQIDPEAIQKEIDSLVNERKGLDEKRQQIYRVLQKRNDLQSQIEYQSQLILYQQQKVLSIREERANDSCETCGQGLDEESTNQVKKNIQARFNAAVEEGKRMTAALKGLKEKLDAVPLAEMPDAQRNNELDDQIYQLVEKRDTARRNAQLQSDIKEATENKERVLQERNESQSIREAIKDFEANRALVMVKKVDSLFTTISVQLFEELKNGNRRDAFEIEMDGKPYSKLSTAEKIRCGLEMVEVLSQQSGVIVPSFVDNAESILKYTAPSGQLITAKVKPGDLKIEIKEEIKEVA